MAKKRNELHPGSRFITGCVCNARIMYEPNGAGNASAYTGNGMRGPGGGLVNERTMESEIHVTSRKHEFCIFCI